MSFPYFPLRSPMIAILLTGGLGLFSSLRASEVLWEFKGTELAPGEASQGGWQVALGEVAQADDAVQLTPEPGRGFRMYRYVKLDFSDEEQPYRYLQVRTSSSDGKAKGAVTNVSKSGGMVGVCAPGITTFDLLNTPSLRPQLGKKGEWAISLYTQAPLLLESVSCTKQPDDGVTLELVASDGDLSAKEGGKIRIKVFTTDPGLAKSAEIQGELVCRKKDMRNPIVAWDGAGGPDLMLQRTSDGLFETEITIDRETVALLAASNGPAMLGVRISGGSVPLLGWAAFSSEDGEGNALVDWQEKEGETAESREKWRELTQGEELARGLPVQFIPKPDYHLTTDENDRYDLTDGKLSSRLDDRVWFAKDAVGWYLNTSSRRISMVVDLGKIQLVGQIAVRFLAGREQNGLRLPNEIEFLASENGTDYHSLQAMVKLMPAEEELSDFRKAFFVPEDGKAFMQAFSCKEAVKARYIAIRVMPEAAVFTDEISVLKALPSQAALNTESYPAASLLTNGIIIRPRQSVMTVTDGAVTPNWFMIEEGLQEPFKTLGLELTVPDAIRFVASDFFQPANEEQNAEKGTRTYHFHDLQNLKRRNFSLYLKRDSATPMPEKATVRLVSLVDGAVSHSIENPLQVMTIPEGPYPDHLDISLAWMHEVTQAKWPEFVESFRRLGFGFMSTFPRYWQNRDADRTWNSSAKERGQGIVKTARDQGYRIVMNDSPFAEMKHTVVANLAAGKLDATELAALALQNKDGSPMDLKTANLFNPFYRGRFYQLEMARIEELVRLTQPDHIYWDIELWWRSAAKAQEDSRIQAAWKKSGKEWREFLTIAGKEMLQDLHQAVQRGMGEKPMPLIGFYAAYATQPHPADGLFEWSDSFPSYLQISMPSLYVQGRVADVAGRIRDENAVVGRQIIPWLTAGTYGPVEPKAMEAMVLETILNGARGLTYYEYADFDPIHFYYHARALATLGRYSALLKSGKPVPLQGSNAGIRTTCFASGDEALVLVGNYARTPEAEVQLPLPPGFGKVSAVSDAEKGEEITAENGKWSVTVPPGEHRLFHLRH